MMDLQNIVDGGFLSKVDDKEMDRLIETSKQNRYTISAELTQSVYSKDLSIFQIDILEFIFYKIRHQYLRKEFNCLIELLPNEISDFTSKYKNNTKFITDSVNEMNGLIITTNMKNANKESKSYEFKTKVLYKGKKVEGFHISFDGELYDVFHNPKHYFYIDWDVFMGLTTKQSKLFYKFLLPYRYFKNELLIDLDDLCEILNIDVKNHTLKNLRKCFEPILENIGRIQLFKAVSIEKKGKRLKNGKKIIEFKIYYEDKKQKV